MQKKKLVIILCSIVAVIIASVSATVGILLSNKKPPEDGGIDVEITAKNVQATIQAEFKVGNNPYSTIKTALGEDKITFSGSEAGESATKSFLYVDDIFVSKGESVLIHYTITNTDASGASAFSVSSSTTITTNKNLKVEYALAEDSLAWADSLSSVADVSKIENSEPLNIYIKISVQDETKSAKFDGKFNFVLQSV